MHSTHQKLVTAITVASLVAVWVIAHNTLDPIALKMLFGAMKKSCGL